jgi:hypothetical protein
MNIEIMRNTLYKAYLDDFAAFCRRLGGATAEVMGGLLSFEVPPRPRCSNPCRGSRADLATGHLGTNVPWYNFDRKSPRVSSATSC